MDRLKQDAIFQWGKETKSSSNVRQSVVRSLSLSLVSGKETPGSLLRHNVRRIDESLTYVEKKRGPGIECLLSGL